MPHRTPAPRRRACTPTHRAPRRPFPVLAGYGVTALVVGLVVSVVLPVASSHRRVAALAATTLVPAASHVVAPGANPGAIGAVSPAVDPAALLADRGTQRPSRSMTVARRAPRPSRVAHRVVIRPLTWALPVSGYHLTGRFGDRSSLWSSGMHTGLDFAAPSGTPIRAVAAGVVRQVGWAGSYGYRTVVSVPGGGEAWYCHQSAVRVSAGQRVAVGQPIGAVGATGNVTGAHLHLEVRPRGERGDPVDPYAVLVSHGLRP